MISKEQINESKEHAIDLFKEYDSIINDLQQYWKGLSHDNLVKKASEFSSEFSKTIESQFDYFSEIFDAFEKSIQKIDIVLDGEHLTNSDDDYISTKSVKAINEKIESVAEIKLDAATQNYNV